MRPETTILFFLILLSCSTTRNITTEEVVGEYKCNVVYGVSYFIELKSDNTFEYHWQMGFGAGKTIGTWRRNENKLILNSDLQPQDDRKYKVFDTESARTDSLKVKVLFKPVYQNKFETIPFALCKLKSDTTILAEAYTDFEGLAKLPRLKADTLIINSIGINIRHKLDSSISQYEFRVYEDLELINYIFFTEEVWKIKNGRLYDPSIKKDKYTQKNYFEKIE